MVPEALVQALRRWPLMGVPERPEAWLYRVARNRALDRLRHDALLSDRAQDIRDLLDRHEGIPEAAFRDEITDDQLRLIFLCCHPDLPRDARVGLTLRTVGGFGVREIARAFLAKEPAVAQRLVRAQRRIRDRGIPFEVPPPEAIDPRVDAVVEVIYLIFNEGYASHDGDGLIKSDLCAEALRLASALCALPATDRPEVHALAALLHFQASRLQARLDGDGDLVLLADQDRTLWDRALMGRGFGHLGRAAAGDTVTPYHLQAAIAAEHARADDDSSTDWDRILALYDRLAAIDPSPVVALNRAVAIARARGPEVGLEAIMSLADHPAMKDYSLYHATRASFLEDAGRAGEARASLARALACPCSRPERRFLERKASALDRP